MTLVTADRVKETWTGTGTGTMTLGGAITAFRTFADIGDTNTCHYLITSVDANGRPTGEWEVGFGTYTLSGTTLARGTVFSNSLGTQAKINFSAGTKHVSNTYSALNGRAVGAKTRLAVSIPVTSGAGLVDVDFDTGDHELWDTDGFHEGITNKSRFTIPAGFDGTYSIVVDIFWTTGTLGSRNIVLTHYNSADTKLNSQEKMVNNTGIEHQHEISMLVQAVGGDYFETQGAQNGAATEDMVGGSAVSSATSFAIARVGN